MDLNWSYSPETPNLGQIRRFLEPCDLEIWRMTLKNNRAPLLSIIKPYAWFHHHMWIQTGVTVRKRLSWVVTSVTLTFDLWPWPLAWISTFNSICNVLGMPMPISVSKLMKFWANFISVTHLSKIKGLENNSLSGPISAIRPGLPCGQGWGEIFLRSQPPQDNSVGSRVVWALPMRGQWVKKVFVAFLDHLFKWTKQ